MHLALTQPTRKNKRFLSICLSFALCKRIVSSVLIPHPLRIRKDEKEAKKHKNTNRQRAETTFQTNSMA
jgi:hypothetical protein